MGALVYVTDNRGKGGSGDGFFTIDHLLLVTHAYIQNFRTVAPILLVEK